MIFSTFSQLIKCQPWVVSEVGCKKLKLVPLAWTCFPPNFSRDKEMGQLSCFHWNYFLLQTLKWKMVRSRFLYLCLFKVKLEVWALKHPSERRICWRRHVWEFWKYPATTKKHLYFFFFLGAVTSDILNASLKIQESSPNNQYQSNIQF